MGPMELLLYALGFFAQVAPPALLIPLAFPASSLRWPRRVLLPAVAGVMVLLALLFAAAACLIYDPAIYWTQGSLLMAAELAVYLVLFYRLCVRAAPVKCLLVTILSIHYAAILYSLNCVMPGSSHLYVLFCYHWGNIGGMALLTALTAPLFALFLVRCLRESLSALEDRMARRGLLYVAIQFFAFCLVASAVPGTDDSSSKLWLISAILGSVVSSVSVDFVFFQEVRAVQERMQADEQLQISELRYQNISQSIEAARRTRHDLRHHLLVINALNAEGKSGELSEYLSRYITVCEELEQVHFSNWPQADSIINYYATQAREAGAQTEVRVAVSRPLPFEAMDITVLLSNLMENCVEAVKMLPHQQRELLVELREFHGTLLVRIRNRSAAADVAGGAFTDSRSFPSTRPSGSGLGLRSVEEIARKYGGMAEFQQLDGWFTARAILNIPVPREDAPS